jgi:hypothetical protein
MTQAQAIKRLLAIKGERIEVLVEPPDLCGTLVTIRIGQAHKAAIAFGMAGTFEAAAGMAICEYKYYLQAKEGKHANPRD